MKKNLKKTGTTTHNTHSRFGISLPEVINMDDISYMSEDDLASRHDQLLSEKDNVLRYELDVKPWEIEICYLQREAQIRSHRRAYHDRFVHSNPDASDRFFYDSEEKVVN